MTWTAAGTDTGAANATLFHTNVTIGNLLVLEVINFSQSTVWATAVSGMGANWVPVGVELSGVNSPESGAVFLGTVTATGSQSMTAPTWSGTAPGNWGWAVSEFNSSVGSWSFDKQINFDTATTNTWPSGTAAAAGELYWGYCTTNSAVNGSTSGFIYNGGIDGVGNGSCYNLNYSSGTAPVWGDSFWTFGVIVLIAEGSGVTAPAARRALPGKTWQRRFKHRQIPRFAPTATLVAFDAVGPSSAGTSSSSSTVLAWTHTVVNGLAVLLAAIDVDDSNTSAMTCTVTCDGVPLTALTAPVASGIGGTQGYLQVFASLGLTAGDHRIVATVSGGTPADINGGSISFTGTSGAATPVTANANADNANIAVNSGTSGGMVAAFATSGSAISGSSPTNRFIINVGSAWQSGNTSGVTSPSTGSIVQTSWTGSGGTWAALGVELLPGTPVQAPVIPVSTPASPGKTWLRHFKHKQYIRPPIPRLAVDVSSPVAAVSSGATTTTAAFSPPANSLLVAFVTADDTLSDVETCTVTSTPALPWQLSKRENKSDNGTGTTVEVWSAQCFTAPGSTTVSVTDSAGAVAKRLFVRVFTDGYGIPAGIGSVAGASAGTLNYLSTVPGSWGWAVFIGTGSVVAGSGQSIADRDLAFDGGDSTIVVQQNFTTPSAGTQVTMSVASNTGVFQFAAAEILPATGDTGIPPSQRPVIRLSQSADYRTSFR